MLSLVSCTEGVGWIFLLLLASFYRTLCPVELFQVLKSLLESGPERTGIEPVVPYRDKFTGHFRESIHVSLEYNATDITMSVEVSSALSSHASWNHFQLLRPEDAGQRCDSVCPSSSNIDLWLRRSSRVEMIGGSRKQ